MTPTRIISNEGLYGTDRYDAGYEADVVAENVWGAFAVVTETVMRAIVRDQHRLAVASDYDADDAAWDGKTVVITGGLNGYAEDDPDRVTRIEPDADGRYVAPEQWNWGVVDAADCARIHTIYFPYPEETTTP